MQDSGFGLPRIPLPETVWKIAEGGISAVFFTAARRQNKPLCPSCELMEVPVWALSGISKQFLEEEFSEARAQRR
jgi:hypothetical protein